MNVSDVQKDTRTANININIYRHYQAAIIF